MQQNLTLTCLFFYLQKQCNKNCVHVDFCLTFVLANRHELKDKLQSLNYAKSSVHFKNNVSEYLHRVYRN